MYETIHCSYIITIFCYVDKFCCQKTKDTRMNKMFSNKEKDSETNDYIEILNKLLELEKQKKKTNPLKITICIVGGIGCVMFIAILCYSILKSEFSLDSILSTLLAFFSIFISIFFYFKADETSTNFYNSSYEFMKDISVTLGKIEERFGEKLNNLNDKISHLDNISSERSAEIQDEKENKDKIINELMSKANLNEEEKIKYKKEIEEKEEIIERLRHEQFRAQREAARLRASANSIDRKDRWEPNREFLVKLLTDDLPSISIRDFERLKILGFMDDKGGVNKELVLEKLNDPLY